MTPRLYVVVAVCASVAAALPASAEAVVAREDAKKCPRGKARVTIAGMSSCRSIASVVPRRRAGNGLAPALRRGLDPTWGETRDGPKQLRQLVGPETVRAIEQKIAAALETFERNRGTRALAAAAAGEVRRFAARTTRSGCSSTQILPETSSGYSQAVAGGGEFSVRMTTGRAGANVAMSVTVPPKSGRAVRITVNLSLCSGERLEVEQCPTAQGVVLGTDNVKGEIKVDQLEDGAVVESSTTKIAITTKLRGEVETDAKLRLLEIDRTESYSTTVGYGRWLGAATQTTLRRRATLSMPGGAVLFGTGSLDVTQSFSGILSFLVDREAARQATIDAARKGSDEAWAKFTDEAIRKYREREAGWQKAGTCAELEFAPASNTLRVRQGQQGLFTGSVKANRGGLAEGDWRVTARTRLGVRPAGNPTPRQRWRYRVDGDGKVSVTFSVTSKAGVASGTWEQNGSSLPRRIAGTFSGVLDSSGIHVTWNGTVAYVRNDAFSSGAGVWYTAERVQFTATSSVTDALGCTGRATSSVTLGPQGPTAILVLSPTPAGGGLHRYTLGSSFPGPVESMQLACPHGQRISWMWQVFAQLLTSPAAPQSTNTRTFAGTSTVGEVTHRWNLTGSR